MKRILGVTAAALVMAAPVFADDQSPAEIFGSKMATDSSSAASLSMAVQVLQGDRVDERLPLAQNEIVTRSTGITPGTEQLAENMGVDADQFTVAELAKMFIGRYD